MLTSVHAAHDVRIYCREARALSREGYRIVLIAQRGDIPKAEDIEIILTRSPRNRLDRILRSIWRIYRTARSVDADIYHFHDPELIPVGLLLTMGRKKVIYDVHEDVPRQIASKDWIPKQLRGMVARAVREIEAFGVKRFSAVITASEEISKRFRELNRQTITVHNYPILKELSELRGGPDSSSVKCQSVAFKRIVSLGGIDSDRCAMEIVEAVGMLPSRLGVRLTVAGECSSERLLGQIRLSPGWHRTKYLGRLPRGEALGVLNESDVALIMYSPMPNHFEVRSNRLFEAMGSGVPVITSDFPKWKEVVVKNNCGLVVNPRSAKEIAEAVKTLIEAPDLRRRMCENGRKAVQLKYNWEMESKKLVNLYRTICEP